MYSIVLVKTGEGGSWLTSSDGSLSSSNSRWKNCHEGDSNLSERSHVGGENIGMKKRVELLESLLSRDLTTLEGKHGPLYILDGN